MVDQLLEFTRFINLDAHGIWQRNKLQFEATLAGVPTVQIMLMLIVNPWYLEYCRFMITLFPNQILQANNYLTIYVHSSNL